MIEILVIILHILLAIPMVGITLVFLHLVVTLPKLYLEKIPLIVVVLVLWGLFYKSLVGFGLV